MFLSWFEVELPEEGQSREVSIECEGDPSIRRGGGGEGGGSGWGVEVGGEIGEEDRKGSLHIGVQGLCACVCVCMKNCSSFNSLI